MASSGAIRAGSAFVELFVDNSKFTKGLAAAKAQFQSVGASFGKVGLALGGAGSAILAPLTGLFEQAVSRGAVIDDLSKKFGATAETVSALAYGFERGGVGLEAFGATIAGLKTKIGEAADENGYLLNNLRSLGRARDLERLPLTEQLDQIAETIERIPDAASQMRAADLLGLGAMLPQLKRGKAGLDELRAAAQAAGAVMSPEQAARSKALMTTFTASWQAVKYALLEVGAALLPTGEKIAAYAGEFQSAVGSARAWLKDNAEVVQTVAAVGAGLVAGGTALAAFGGSLSAAGAGIGAVATVVSGFAGTVLSLGTALAGAVPAAGLLAGGLAYLGYRLLTRDQATAAVDKLGAGFSAVARTVTGVSAAVGDSFRDVAGVVTGVGGAAVAGFGDTLGRVGTIAKDTFGGVLATARQTFGGVREAIAGGDLKGALELALQGIELAWQKIILGLTRAWREFVAGLGEAEYAVNDEVERRAARTYDPTWKKHLNTFNEQMRYLVEPSLGREGVENHKRRLQAINDEFANDSQGQQDAIKQMQDEARAERQKKRKAEVDAGLKPETSAVDKLQKKFDETVAGRRAATEDATAEDKKVDVRKAAGKLHQEMKTAAAAAAAAEQGGGFGSRLAALAKLAKPGNVMPALADAAKGIFSGPAQQQLGYGSSIGQQQLDAQRGIMKEAAGINKNVGVLPDMAKGVNGLVQQLKFK